MENASQSWSVPADNRTSSGLMNILVVKSYASMVSLVLLCSISWIAYRLAFHPLSKFPGPLEARILGTWRSRRFWRGSWHDDVLAVHKKYGPVVRIAPNELSVVDEKVIKELYNHGTKALKTSWYATWDASINRPGVFSAQDKGYHSFLRKRVSAVYSMSAMLRYEGSMQSCLNTLMTHLRKHAEQSGEVNMSDWTDALTYDVVGELAYGTSLGQLETESDNMGIRKLIHDGFYLTTNVGHYYGQSRWFTHPYLRFLGVPDPFSSFRTWTMAQITARRNSSSKAEREDMLSHFLKMKSTDGQLVGDDDVFGEAANIIGAGADTTSIAMRACLYYLLKHPNIYSQVQEEIDRFYQSQNLTQPVTYQQTQELPFLCAVVREATRLHPSITYPLLRHFPEPLVVAGKSIPAGTAIGVSPGAANRNPAIWGDDAEEFIPSRWIGDAEKLRYMNSVDMTFGGTGPRMCIGRNLALVEVHKFVAQMLRTFDLEFVNPEKPWRLHSQWFCNQHDMFLKIKYRGNELGTSML